MSAAAAAAGGVAAAEGKRKADEQAGGDEHKRAKRSTAPAKGALEEAGDEGPDTETPDEAVARRLLLEQYSTPLLWAWLKDFPGGAKLLKAGNAEDREFILQLLVLHTRTVPDDLAQAQAVWRKKSKKQPTHPAPGMYEPVLSAEALAALEAAAHTAGDANPMDVGDSDYDEDGLPAVDEPDPNKRLFGGGRHSLPLPSPSAPTQFERGPGPRLLECLTCGVAPHPSVVSASGCWMCDECGIRGDLPISHEINVFHRAKVLAAVGPKAPDGQSNTDTSSAATSAGGKQISVLQRHFNTLREGAQHVSFTSSKENKIGHKDALLLSQRAYLGASHERPSDELVDLIRWGRLPAVAFAVPRPLHRADRGADSAAGTFQLGADGSTTFTPKDPRPEPVKDLASFCAAMFGTVLPSLVDKPMALANWCALGRSAIALHNQLGQWAPAAQYVDMALTSAIDGNFAFGPAVLDAMLNVRMSSFGAASGGNSGGTEPQQGGRAADACHAWNRGLPCTRGQHCPFLHICQICGGAHKAPDEPACAAAHQRRRGPQARGGRGGYRGGGRGSRQADSSVVSNVKSAKSERE